MASSFVVSIGAVASHLAQFPLLGEFPTQGAQLVHQRPARLDQSSTGRHLSIGLDAQFKGASNKLGQFDGSRLELASQAFPEPSNCSSGAGEREREKDDPPEERVRDPVSGEVDVRMLEKPSAEQVAQRVILLVKGEQGR